MVADQLRDRLAAARRRGLDFDHAWAPAVAAEIAALNTRWQRDAWLEALEGTRAAWRRAYLLEPQGRQERAIAAVLTYFELKPEPRPAAITVW